MASSVKLPPPRTILISGSLIIKVTIAAKVLPPNINQNEFFNIFLNSFCELSEMALDIIGKAVVEKVMPSRLTGTL